MPENHLQITRRGRERRIAEPTTSVIIRESDHEKLREIAYRARIKQHEVLHLFIQFAYERTQIIGEVKPNGQKT